jgi:N-acyl-L-homoserine lactone synthetase
MSRVITAHKVLSPQDREAALAVVQQVFLEEKRWIESAEAEIPADPTSDPQRSFFLVRVDGEPAGLIRLVYDPPLEIPPELEVKLDREIDLEALREGRRFVEIGRFMIVPEHRRNIRIALRLMQASIREVVERGYSHLLTDVFENEPHSPLHFHTSVLGFERLGTHRYGELKCECVRIILILDIVRAYRRLRVHRNKVFRELTAGIAHLLEGRAA